MAEEIYDEGDMLIENGKITAIANDINKDCKTINARGLTVLPGFIEAHSHIGIEETNNENPGNLNEIGNPVTPFLNALDGLNFYDISFKKALEAGVTTIATGPGSANVIGGTFSVVNTFSENIFERVVNKKSSMKIALGDNPKRIYSSKGKSPVTKMGITYLLKNTLNQAKRYFENGLYKSDSIFNDIIPVLQGDMPFSVHAHRADDILTAIRIFDEYNVKIQLLHATEGQKLIREIKYREIPIIFGPILNCSKKVETREKGQESMKEFLNEDMLIAISTDHPITPIEYLSVSAGVCVGKGMDYDKALKAITINPAKILGIDNNVGSLEIGKQGDIVLIDGDPLCSMSKVKMVIGNGKIVYEKRSS